MRFKSEQSPEAAVNKVVQDELLRVERAPTDVFLPGTAPPLHEPVPPPGTAPAPLKYTRYRTFTNDLCVAPRGRDQTRGALRPSDPAPLKDPDGTLPGGGLQHKDSLPTRKTFPSRPGSKPLEQPGEPREQSKEEGPPVQPREDRHFPNAVGSFHLKHPPRNTQKAL